LNSKRKKSPRQPKLDAVATIQSQSVAVCSPRPETVQKPLIPGKSSEAAEKAFRN